MKNEIKKLQNLGIIKKILNLKAKNMETSLETEEKDFNIKSNIRKEIKNKEANMNIMRSLIKLANGEYRVKTSKGNFKIKVSGSGVIKPKEYIPGFYEDNKVLIFDENDNLFAEYFKCYCSQPPNYWDYAKEIDYYDTSDFEYTYKVNLKERHNDSIMFFNKEGKVVYHVIFLDLESCGKVYKTESFAPKKAPTDAFITDYKNSNRKIIDIDSDNILFINDNKDNINEGLLKIDLSNFDKIMDINGMTIRVPMDEDIENKLSDPINKDLLSELTEKKVSLNDLKSKEKELLKYCRLYLGAKKILTNAHELNTMIEIVSELNPKFRKTKMNKKHFYESLPHVVDELYDKLKELHCGVYFVDVSNLGKLQIDILYNSYRMSDEKGNNITSLDRAYTQEIIDGIDIIIQNQKEDEEMKKIKRRCEGQN